MPDRLPLIAANWKMNTTLAEGLELCAALRERLDGVSGVEVVVCPPFTHLAAAAGCLAGSSLLLGSQNLFWETHGAFTGEVSPIMLRDLVQYVILGHSERRNLFAESDVVVNRKLRAAQAAGLLPIFCLGETAGERQAGETDRVLRRQVREGLAGIDLDERFVVAYEPVWAIGTGQAANAEQAQAAIALIRAEIAGIAGANAARLRVLYGGSVTAANIADFMRAPDIDGALVGGASLSADSFAGIVEGAQGEPTSLAGT